MFYLFYNERSLSDMFNLICGSLNSVIYGGIYNGIYLTLGSNSMIIDYLIAIISSIIVALILKVPLMPKSRYSFNTSALYPTPVIAVGILSIFFILGYYWAYDGMILSLIIGIASALFVKYLFYYVFPAPNNGDDSQ